MVCGVTCYNCNWCVVSECFYLISQVVHKYMVMVGAYSWCVVTWCWTNQPAQRREQFIAFCRTLRLRPCSRSLPMATCILYTLTGTVPLKFLLLLFSHLCPGLSSGRFPFRCIRPKFLWITRNRTKFRVDIVEYFCPASRAFKKTVSSCFLTRIYRHFLPSIWQVQAMWSGLHLFRLNP